MKRILKNILRSKFNKQCFQYNKFKALQKNIFIKLKNRHLDYKFPFIDNFKYQPKSDTLFIFGLGNTINEISDTQWKVIAAHDSIGFNGWMVHQYVPDIYMFEGVHFNTDFERDGIRTFFHNFNLRHQDYQNTSIIYKMNSSLSQHLLLEEVPESIRHKIYLSPVITLSYHDRPTFIIALKTAVEELKKSNNFLHIHTAATVFDLVMLAYKLRFKKIVLAGIDLTTNYFFDDEDVKNRIVEQNLKLPPIVKVGGDIHPTEKFKIPISWILGEIDRLLLAPNGIELFVTSCNSRLHPQFKNYFGV